jgi:hypothetical protein
MPALFLSHATEDDAVVRKLQRALEQQGTADAPIRVWSDSRELKGGDALWPEVEQQIRAADAFLLLVSPAAFQSDWVPAELALALEVQRAQGADHYRVIPLTLDGTRLGAFRQQFASRSGDQSADPLGSGPAYIPLASGPNGIAEVLPKLRAALGLELLADLEAPVQPTEKPLEDLVLELTDLGFHVDENSVRRARARARLVYDPADPGAREVRSRQDWRLIAPIGPIEAGELAWYLEKWPIWPGTPYQARAGQVERDLVAWGKLLHQAALPAEHAANVLAAWQNVHDSIPGGAARRFSVQVDAATIAGAGEAEQREAREAATTLPGLPWELLHNGTGFLFQGARPTRVRRRLPSTQHYDTRCSTHRSAFCWSARARRTTPAAASTTASRPCR